MLKRDSLLFKLAFPIPVCLCLGLLLAGIFLPGALKENALAAATEAARQSGKQIQTIRAYYTKNVIADVKASSDLRPGIEHQNDPNVIPLPATFVHDVSALLAAEQTALSLYSPYPFAKRSDRQMDDFMTQAWAELSQNTEARFQRIETIEGEQILRVAVADTMVSEVCVSCHNSVAGSPKTDWQLGDLRGIIEVRRNVETVLAGTTALANKIMIALVVAGAALLALAIFVARSVTLPFDRLCRDITLVVGGNLETKIVSAQRQDEIGRIGKALTDMQDRLREAKKKDDARNALQQEQHDVVQQISTGLQRLSRGDFTKPITERFSGSHDKLRTNYNQTIDTLSGTIAHVINASQSIKNGAAEVSQSSDDLSHRTETQAATLEETAAALDALTASVRSAADGAQSVERTMSEARQEAESSSEVVQSAVNAMTEIEASSNHIAQIISVIDDIAFQTNLLALNAGVEAARAGDAGRGFAVVASEVRLLAQRSSDAAMEIKTLINESSKQVSRGVDLVGKAGSALTRIVGRVNEISELVADIAKSSATQSSGLAEINSGVSQLDKVTQQNAGMVEESNAAGHLLNSDAADLAQVVAKFQIQTEATHLADNSAAPRNNSTPFDLSGYEVWGEDSADHTKQANPPAAAAGGQNRWLDF